MNAEIISMETAEKLQRIDRAIRRISLIRMDSETSPETHKALDEVLKILLGEKNEGNKED